MAGITTHVLDTTNGRPAAGMLITLEIQRGDEWEEVARVITNDDGRARFLETAETATYRATFATGAYNPDGFYPRAVIEFKVTEPERHTHVPLLLAPFGYSTYRGS